MSAGLPVRVRTYEWLGKFLCGANCRRAAVVLFESPLTGGTMSNDPLLFSEISIGPANDAEYDVVYAAITANERGRSFLREYASRIGRPDTQSLIGTISRLEAAMRDNALPQLPPVLVRGLVDLAAAIQQVETVLAINGNSVSDDLFAAERIQDIAMALRRRDVEAALCDALEASSREVGDAIVRSSAAAARAMSAASQLRDLIRRVSELIALVVAVAGPAALSGDRPAAGEMPDHPAAERFDETRRESSTGAVDAQFSVEQPAESRLDAALVYPLLPDMQAPAGLDDGAGNPRESAALPIPSPIFTAVQHAAPLKNQAPNGNLWAESSAPDVSVSSPVEAKIEKKTQPTSLLRQPYFTESSAAPAHPRVVANDPLAAVLALSEEELIALFS